MLKLDLNAQDNWIAYVIMCAKHVRKHTTMFSFSVSSAVHGFHVYKAIWKNLAPGEEWGC